MIRVKNKIYLIIIVFFVLPLSGMEDHQVLLSEKEEGAVSPEINSFTVKEYLGKECDILEKYIIRKRFREAWELYAMLQKCTSIDQCYLKSRMRRGFNGLPERLKVSRIFSPSSVLPCQQEFYKLFLKEFAMPDSLMNQQRSGLLEKFENDQGKSLEEPEGKESEANDEQFQSEPQRGIIPNVLSGQNGEPSSSLDPRSSSQIESEVEEHNIQLQSNYEKTNKNVLSSQESVELPYDGISRLFDENVEAPLRIDQQDRQQSRGFFASLKRRGASFLLALKRFCGLVPFKVIESAKFEPFELDDDNYIFEEYNFVSNKKCLQAKIKSMFLSFVKRLSWIRRIF